MSSQKKEHNRSRELFYNESRENAYNRQKDLRREIEIDVPELIENDDYPTEQYTEERESLMDKNNVRAFMFYPLILKAFICVSENYA